MLAAIKCLVLICLVFRIKSSSNCGQSLVTTQEGDWRIVGGTTAAKGEFPWQVVLNRVYEEDGELMMEQCGGTILDQKWVLTAAHCVAKSSDANQYSIKLGTNDISAGGGYKSKVIKVIYHEKFDETTVSNDIALVKLDSVIDFSKYTDLMPICLANQSLNLTNNCISSGFGYTSAKGPASDQLLKVSQTVVEDSVCARVHRRYNPKTNVCAGGSAKGGTGTCMGDSGGPLQCKGSDDRYYQVGVVSYGDPCGLPNDPDVFTKVSAYVDWISKTIASN